MAQFVVVPPLSRVASLFKAATGQVLGPDMSWPSWLDVSAAEIEAMRPYIRTCHQKILNETLAGKCPCAFLRQILRPHGYRIETVKSGWALKSGPPTKGICVKIGKEIDWVT